jgi:hypothetical protein
LLTIVAMLGAAALWIGSQHPDLQQLKSREDPKPHLEKIEGQLSEVLQTQAAMKQQLEDFSRRVDERRRKWNSVPLLRTRQFEPWIV